MSKCQYNFPKKNKYILLFIAAITLAITLSIPFDKQSVVSSNSPAQTTQVNCACTIYEVIAAKANSSSDKNAKYSFDKLEKALKATDLQKMLSDKNQKFTVFAPSDKAFDSLLPGSFDNLLNQQDKTKLKKILQYHILLQEIDSKNFKTTSMDTAAPGSKVKIKVDKQSIKLGDEEAKIEPDARDWKASNGVIHVIDKVILPIGTKL